MLNSAGSKNSLNHIINHKEIFVTWIYGKKQVDITEDRTEAAKELKELLTVISLFL